MWVIDFTLFLILKEADIKLRQNIIFFISKLGVGIDALVVIIPTFRNYHVTRLPLRINSTCDAHIDHLIDRKVIKCHLHRHRSVSDTHTCGKYQDWLFLIRSKTITYSFESVFIKNFRSRIRFDCFEQGNHLRFVSYYDGSIAFLIEGFWAILYRILRRAAYENQQKH